MIFSAFAVPPEYQRRVLLYGVLGAIVLRRFALTRFQDRMHRISVRLSDVNGPKGGVDKRCLVRIKADGLPDIVVEDTETDLYVAVDRAVDRTRRTLERHWKRAGNPLNEPFQRGNNDDWI